jgi:CRP-like cAMP-binding protein
MKINLEIVSRCPLFNGIPASELGLLLQQVHHQVQSYNKGELIVFSGDPCNKLLIVAQGSVKGEMIDLSGKTIKIEDIGAPRPLATAFLFGEQNQFPVNIVANEPTLILNIPKESVVRLLSINTNFLENFLNTISNRAQFLSDRIRFLSLKTIKGKIANFILDAMDKNSFTVRLNKTQQELADYFGITRPSLGRVFGEMEKEGIITVRKKEIVVENVPELNKYLY